MTWTDEENEPTEEEEEFEQSERSFKRFIAHGDQRGWRAPIKSPAGGNQRRNAAI
jgi:hypothetical protein